MSDCRGPPHERLPWFPRGLQRCSAAKGGFPHERLHQDRCGNKFRTQPLPMSDCIKTLTSCQFPAYCRAGKMPTLLLFRAKTDATPEKRLMPAISAGESKSSGMRSEFNGQSLINNKVFKLLSPSRLMQWENRVITWQTIQNP
ncbi:MAG: hypothetical protein F6K65_39495 [Moorea sp. SIO3C2]|nr:hypothetical protein [Moorena sp. SIO3C2]